MEAERPNEFTLAILKLDLVITQPGGGFTRIQVAEPISYATTERLRAATMMGILKAVDYDHEKAERLFAQAETMMPFADFAAHMRASGARGE